jgi:hypothetical protein
MKTYLFFILILCGNVIPQELPVNSILQLETEIKSSPATINTEAIIREIEDEKKSVGLGIIYSLLLPGMGELYADAYDIGKYFTIADGILWGTYIGMSSYASWQEDNYKTYAGTYAGVDHSNKDEDYYATIGEYSSVESYNNQKALERNFDEMYDEQEYFWKWQTTDERKIYRDMWTSSEQTNNDLRFVVGGLILNRIISAINAARLVSSYNSSLKDEMSWNLSAGFDAMPNLPTSLSVRFSKSF